jgi:hypothetical protein
MLPTRPPVSPTNLGPQITPIRANALMIAKLGELIPVAFDQAAQYGTSPQKVSLLGTGAVTRLLRHPKKREPDFSYHRKINFGILFRNKLCPMKRPRLWRNHSGDFLHGVAGAMLCQRAPR